MRPLHPQVHAGMVLPITELGEHACHMFVKIIKRRPVRREQQAVDLRIGDGELRGHP